jgi:Fic family protein
MGELELFLDHLTQVRVTGDWESWLEFFLRGVRDTAEQAVSAARSESVVRVFLRRMIAMLDADRKKLEALGRPAASVLRIHEYTKTRPIVSTRGASAATGISYPMVAGAV